MALTQPKQQAVDAGSGLETSDVPVYRPASPWLDVPAAAAYLGYDMAQPAKAADALRALVRRHGLPAYRRGTRLVLHRTDLDKWLRGNRVAG